MITKCRSDLVAWSRVAFGNTRDRLDRKQKGLEEMVENGYGLNMETINDPKKEINDLLHHEEVSWRQRSKSKIFSIKEEGRITLMACMTEKGRGRPVWIVCPGLLMITIPSIRNYSHLQIQITWMGC